MATSTYTDVLHNFLFFLHPHLLILLVQSTLSAFLLISLLLSNDCNLSFALYSHGNTKLTLLFGHVVRINGNTWVDERDVYWVVSNLFHTHTYTFVIGTFQSFRNHHHPCFIHDKNIWDRQYDHFFNLIKPNNKGGHSAAFIESSSNYHVMSICCGGTCWTKAVGAEPRACDKSRDMH